MKTRFNYLLNASVLSVALAFTGCEGDQGEVGPQGTQGIAGTAGATGANGTGFDELTQYGNIEITISGKTEEEVDFSQSMNFNYMPSDGIRYNSTVSKESDTDMWFDLGRENKGKVISSGRSKGGSSMNYVNIELEHFEDVLSIDFFEFNVDIITNNFKTFRIDFNSSNFEFNFEESITNYSYDPATGKLKFNFTYTIPAELSETDFELTFTGKVDVIVFESLDNNEE